MQKFWPDSFDLPKPMNALVPMWMRRRLAEDYAMKSLKATWEPNVMNFMREIRGRLFVDIGANVGIYATLLEHNFDRIIAIEADPMVYDRLQKLCPSNCKPLNVLVSNIEEEVSFYRKLPSSENGTDLKDLAWGSWAGSIYPANKQEWTPNAQTEEEIRLPSSRLATILAKEAVVDLVKVDVEGAEWLVLEGAEPIMSKIKCWVVELHEPHRSLELETRMRKYGYNKIEWLDTSHIASQR